MQKGEFFDYSELRMRQKKNSLWSTKKLENLRLIFRKGAKNGELIFFKKMHAHAREGNFFSGEKKCEKNTFEI